MRQQVYTSSSNGIQSFSDASPDYELAPVGLASMRDQAERLAQYGRNGDIYVVHAAEGETVIPLEVLNANPKVKELLFNQMRDMGLDPQEFVIGNELNSINPDTGLPEFFFKSIFRAVKSAVKSVVKIVKKAAPIVIPLAASAFGIPFLGPAFGAGSFGAAALGGGLGSLAGGGSLKDAFKAGLTSGGLSLATTGIGSLFNDNVTFGDAIKGSFSGVTNITGPGGASVGRRVAASPFAQGTSPEAVAGRAASESQWSNILGGKVKEGLVQGPFGPASTDSPGYIANPTAPVQRNLFDSLGVKIGERFPPGSKAAQRQVAALKAAYGKNPAPAAAAKTSLLSEYGPSIALATGAAYLGGAFDPQDPEDVSRDDLEGFVPRETGADLIDENPDRYMLADTNPYRYDRTGNVLVPTMYAADGGFMGSPPQYPRREMLIEGPGTERSDDIPAMLSDGEFVLNAQSVRGADPTGQGDRYRGAQNLYNMMRNFEMRA